MFLTSDLHFFHKRVLEFCPETRPFETLEEMHEHLISQWNSKVQKKNTRIFHLGDISFGTPDETESVVSRLNGDITFISGNHCYSRTKEVLKKYGHVTNYAEIKHNKILFILMHYPILDWRNKARGSIHCFGHEHGRIKHLEENMGKCMDVGWDAVEKILHFDEVISLMESREIKPVGHHTEGKD